jgi:hypothetical protein
MVLAALFCCTAATAATYRLKDGQRWQSVASEPREEYVHAVTELKDIVRSGDTEAVKAALAQLKEAFPQYVGPDLDMFIEGELQYWKNHYARSMAKFEKLLKDSPGSEFAQPAMEREFDIGQAYLEGRKKKILGFINISGHAEGVEIMERLSDRDGLEDPDGVGLRAAVAVAESYEARAEYLEAYLKWSEIASYWETGPIAKRALFRMAANNLAAYNAHPTEKQPRFDASKLTTARTYFERFQVRYPEDAKRLEIAQRIAEIDEQMAQKQLYVGQYYDRVGKTGAANFYFKMVVENWPTTAAAETAKTSLEASGVGEPVREQ